MENCTDDKISVRSPPRGRNASDHTDGLPNEGEKKSGWPPSNEALSSFMSHWRPLEQEDLCSSDYYFDSYAHFGIHEDMLKDQVRTGSYCKAITQNKHLFRGKVVLDVGSGTGILSMFAARAGAKHVYGVEHSHIIATAEKICAANDLSNKITFIRGKVEEIELPVKKVDILISEWMGYFLLYESMLDTVLFARDKWLSKDGLIFPDRACLYIAAIEDAEFKEQKFGFWSNIYGFDFGVVTQSVIEEPIVDTVEQQAVATDSCCVLDLNLKTAKADDLNFAAFFTLKVQRKDFLHALVGWFDVHFTCCHKTISFTTGPFGRYTHWKQTVFYLDDVIVADKDDLLTGLIAVKKSDKNHRDLDVKITYSFCGPGQDIENTQYYRLR